MHMLSAGQGRAEMIKPVLEQDPGDGHAEFGGIGEIR
jgi:hypothetical protein